MTDKGAAPDARWAPTRLYSYYVLAVLVLINALSYLDRQVMVILIEPIQQDLGLSDVQMGVIIGPAFMLLFLGAALPMGHLADRGQRNWLLAAGILVWSLATMWMGQATSFGELAMARACVGLGEACVVPAVFSLVTDYFAPEHRGRATAVVSTGIPIGAGAALFGGGLLLVWAARENITLPWAGAERPWEVLLTLFGLAGIGVALLAASIAEPRRKRPSPESVAAVSETASPSPGGFAAYLRANARPLSLILIPYILLVYMQIAALSWIPSMLVRRHGLSQAEAGMIVGTIIVTVPIVTSLVAGAVADYLFRRFAAGPFLLLTWCGPLMLPSIMIVCWADGVPLLMLGLTAMSVVGAICSTTVFSALPAMTPPRFRARQLALYSLLAQLLGLGAGPLVVAAVSDYIFEDRAMLHYAIVLAVVPAWFVASWCGAIGHKSYALLRRRTEAGQE